MDIMQFAEEVKNELIGRIDGVTDIAIKETLKNNSVTLTSLVFTDQTSNITPNIHLDALYRQYEETRDMDAVTEWIMDSYEASRLNTSIDMSFFRDWEQVKPLIAYKLINTEKNKELLEQIPHKEIMDLSMVCYASVQQGTILIYHTHCDMWGIDTEELLRTAQENTPQSHPMKFQSMGRHMFSMIDVEPDEDLDALIEMYVLSNTSGVFGAAAMLYPDSMEQIAVQLDSNFYILPSSIHETIILPEDGHEPSYLTEMVREINANVLATEEILGDNVYFYDRNGKELKMVA